MSASLGEALLAPRSIALIGASSDVAKNTSRPQRYLRKHGFSGSIFPINRARQEVFGERAYPDLRSVGQPIDHALIMIPAGGVADAVRQCGECGVPVATIFSDGFAEAGEAGALREREVREVARQARVRLVGPNSIGLINVHTGAALSVNAVLELDRLTPGGLAVVSQSGSMLGTLLSRGEARGIGFSTLVSVGNEADLTVADIADLLVDDPETHAILLFLEGIRDGARLAAMARRAHAARKPVIAYKLGRSTLGQTLAASHTGALSGEDELVDLFLRTHGILRVDMIETLMELAPLVVGRLPARRVRVAAMTTTGGGAAMVVDRLGTFGVEVVAPSEAVIARLAAKSVTVAAEPLIDLTLAGTRGEVYGAVLDELLAWDGCEAVLAVVGSSAQFHPQHAVAPIAATAPPPKPLAVFLTPDAPQSLDLLRQAGIAAFRTPEACADALRALARWRAPAEKDEDVAAAARAAVVRPLLAAASDGFDEHAASAVFASLGIAQARSTVMAGPGEPCSLRFPVVAKILSPDILHKTEIGAVVLGIADEAELRDACARILASARAANPAARITGILVQEMERGLAEVMIGLRRDPQVGPVIVLAVGGVLAEIYGDSATRLAPVSVAEARTMIDEVRGLAPIRGYRGLPKGDCLALAEAVSRFSCLALSRYPFVSEAEINPLIVKRDGEGVVAVDALLVCTQDRGTACH